MMPRGCFLLLLGVGLLSAALPAATAQAQGLLTVPPLPPLPPERPSSPFLLKLPADLPITLGSAALALGAELAKSALPGPFCLGPGAMVCDPQSLNALDRTVVGNHSVAARTASDVLIGLNVGFPFALDLIDVLVNRPDGSTRDAFSGYGQDVLVLAEVLAVDAGLNAVVKYAVRRPRPLAYDPSWDAADRSAPDAALSFYSEHSSISFAMATAYSYLFMKRHPGSRLIAPVWILFEGLAATTAYLRVQAGMHFYTDVLTGAFVGSAIGLLIPYLHQRAMPAHVPLLGSSSHLRFTAAPSILANGGGFVVTIEQR